MLQCTARSAMRLAHVTQSTRRTMAIAATVKVAPDTSALDFPAPSHVSLAGEAAKLARQIRDFYKSPDSVIEIPQSVREEILNNLIKKTQMLPDTEVTPDTIRANCKIPERVRLGDSPIFKAINKSSAV